MERGIIEGTRKAIIGVLAAVCLMVLVWGMSQVITMPDPGKVMTAEEIAAMREAAISEADGAGIVNGDVAPPPKDKTYSILFVGNSKTYEGHVPEKLRDLAQAAGYEVDITEVSAAGRQLWQNLDIASARRVITAKSYDYVILQEQTDTSLSGGPSSKFQQGATGIASLVRENNPDAQIVIRQTWVRTDSTERVRSGAMAAAEQVAAACETSLISRDGKAMYFGESQGLALFADRVHQNKSGGYLCACCIYKVIFGSPVGNPYTAGLRNAEALQVLADIY